MTKDEIRRETDGFLNDVQESSSYTPNAVGNLPSSQTYTAVDPNTFSTTTFQDSITREGERGRRLTGARRAYLPMTISVSGKDGYRIEFTMLINPNSLNHGKTHTVNSAYTRLGWIPQIWGLNQDTIQATGKTAMFMAPSAGATTDLKKYTFGFLNFMALVAAYKNNGYRAYDPVSDSKITRIITTVQGVELSYDGQIYMGHFNTFSLDESEENPFIFDYNFEFVCSTLAEDYAYVRGHFEPIKDKEQSQETTSSEDQQSNRSTISNLPKSSTLFDVSSNGPTAEVDDWTSKPDESVLRVWERVSALAFPPDGLPWTEAISRGYTDGSPQENLKLRGQLLSQGTSFFE